MSKITKDWYSFVERPASLLYSVKILKGKYEGVVVTYGKVALKEESDVLRLNFQFKIEESPKINVKKLEQNDEFRNFLGDILSHIIDSSFKSGAYKLGDKADKMTLLAKDATESPTDNSSEAR